MQREKQDYIFSTDVLESSAENEFVVEFFPYRREAQGENKPSTVTRNFEELIDFLEQLEEA